MKLKFIVGLVLILIGLFFLWIGSSLSNMQAFSWWTYFKYYLLAILFGGPGLLFVIPNFAYGSLFNREQKNFPDLMGVRILSMKYDPSHNYDGSKRKSWNIIMENTSSEAVVAWLNFTMVDKKGITQNKSTLSFDLDPFEKIEKRISPMGNTKRGEREEILLKSIEVWSRVTNQKKMTEIKRVIGRAGRDVYRSCVSMIIFFILFIWFIRSGLPWLKDFIFGNNF